MKRDPIDRLRRVGRLEGVSFLALLGVAMPLKYLAGQPLAVQVVGWLHGGLFVWFCAALVAARQRAGLPWGLAALAFLAALLPAGPFLIDRHLAAARGGRPRVSANPPQT